MSNSLYNGSSEGFSILTNGYIDYGKEVISRRSLPDLRDGLKPVGRRCIYASSKLNNDTLNKCLTVVGEISKIHPHGDSSVYQALCGMTDRNGSMLAPVFVGSGNLGKVVSSAPPAHARYPKARLGLFADTYLRDMEACELIPSEEGDGFEPKVLPVRFPSALVNGTSGMAVSVSTSIPSFNIREVIELTQEYLKTGKCETVIAPDFPTGGVLVRDERELTKIMHTGKGKLKIRANVDIKGKEIYVKEIPFGKTVEGIVSAIKKMEIPGVSNVRDDTGYDSQYYICITCRTLKVVESVLMHLYKNRILQTSFASNMLYVEDEEPVITGVYGVIERWVAWRRKVVTTKFTLELASVEKSIAQFDYFVRLVSNAEWRDTYVDTVVHKSKAKGREYLKEIFEDIPDDICEWISGRSLPSFNNGGRYATKYAELKTYLDTIKNILDNVDEWIWQDLEDLKREKAEFMDRRTIETNLDYRFTSISESDIEDDSYAVYTLYRSGFLTKGRSTDVENKSDVVCQVEAQANSTLIGFDCLGRLLRVYGTDIPFTSNNSNGEYMPRYFGVEGLEGDYRINYLGLLDGTTRMLVYSDGFVGFLDTSEWLGKKKIRVVQNGVDMNVFDKLVEVIEEKDIPEYLVVADEHGDKVRLGVALVNNIRIAGRRSRAKVFGGNNVDIKYIGKFSYIDLARFMEEPLYYSDRMREPKGRAVYGDISLLVEGRYYEETSKIRNNGE